MRDLDEQLRAWADQSHPVTADEARTRATEPDLPVAANMRPGSGGLLGSPSRRLLVAAAVVLLVVGGLVVMTQSGDGDEVQIGEQPDGTQPTPTPTDPAPTDTEPVDGEQTTTTRPAPNAHAEPPPTWVGADDQERLVVVDTANGEVLRVLAEFDDPDAEPTSDDPVLGTFLGPITLSSDGLDVYYETCCEPAVGVIFRISVEGGEPEFVTNGTDPALSPDGAHLAVVELQWLKVIELSTGREVRVESPEPPMALRRPSWSPNGIDLVFERYDGADDGGIDRAGRVVGLSVTPLLFEGSGSLDLDALPTLAEPDGDLAPIHPVFGPDGLEVIYESLPAGDQPPTESWLRVLDVGVPDLGDPDSDGPATVLASERLPESVVARSRPHQGGPILMTFASGRVVIGGSGVRWITLGEGYLSAAW